MVATNEKERFYALDGTRGIFSIFVFFYHARNNTFLTDNFMVQGAPYFLEYFFVLSGFVVSYNYADKIKDIASFKSFVRNRFFRLYPLLFFTVVLYFIVLSLGKKMDIINNIELQTWSQMFLALLDSLLMTNSTPLMGTTFGINYPSWSISAEFISYLFFAFVLLLRFKSQNLLFISAGLVSLICFNYLGGETGTVGFLYAIYCFCLGYLVFLFWKRYKYLKVGSWIEASLLAILLFSLILMFCFENLYSVLFFPYLFAAMVFILATGRGFLNKLLTTKPALFLGKISYSIYLNQAIVLIAMEKIMFTFLRLPADSLTVNFFYLFLSMMITICYSHFTNRYIEVGLGKYFKKRSDHRTVESSYQLIKP